MNDFQPQTILGVAAHPDDLEFSIAGSVVKWVKQGATAYYLILTNGNKGSKDRSLSPGDLRDLRRKEQQKAADVAGVKQVFFCDFNDGELEVAMELKREIVRIIRQVKPDTVLTMDPTFVYSVKHGFINHTDHRAAGQATLDAVFPLARDHLSFPELDSEEGLSPHIVKTVLLTNLNRSNFSVDITDTIETKVKALAAHASQIPKDKSADQIIKDLAKSEAADTNYHYAENFVRIDVQ